MKNVKFLSELETLNRRKTVFTLALERNFGLFLFVSAAMTPRHLANETTNEFVRRISELTREGTTVPVGSLPVLVTVLEYLLT